MAVQPCFENPKGSDIPVLANLFGAERRVTLGMGEERVEALREVGELLAYLRQPDPPKGFRDLVDKAPLLKDPDDGAKHHQKGTLPTITDR